MDEAQRAHIRREIATLEADNRGMQHDLRSKESLVDGYPASQKQGLLNQIQGLKNLISGNEQKIRDYQRQL
ncbi:hypothetical protein [Microbacterium xylanilyticum]